MFERPSPLSPDHVGDPMQYVRVGQVIEVDRATATCTVEVADPDEASVTTHKIQWGAIRAGETIVWAYPSEGEQVILLCPDGDIAQAIAVPGLYSDSFPAPDSGTRQFVRFGDGGEIGYDPDAHHFDITLPGDATAEIRAEGGLTIHGDVTVHGDVTADGVSLKQHVHTGTAPGGGVSGIPDQ